MAELMYLLAPLTFALMVGLPIGLALWMAARRDKQKANRRGFDVAPGSREQADDCNDRD